MFFYILFLREITEWFNKKKNREYLWINVKLKGGGGGGKKSR